MASTLKGLNPHTPEPETMQTSLELAVRKGPSTNFRLPERESATRSSFGHRDAQARIRERLDLRTLLRIIGPMPLRFDVLSRRDS